MLFKFRTNKLSDSLKLAEFLEKSGINFEVQMDISVGVDGSSVQPEEDLGPKAPVEIKPNALGITPIAPVNDPLWRPAPHPGDCGGRGVCKEVVHYGAEAL